jgi:hypothetical protein
VLAVFLSRSFSPTSYSLHALQRVFFSSDRPVIANMIVDFTPRNASELQVIGGKGKMNARDHTVKRENRFHSKHSLVSIFCIGSH